MIDVSKCLEALRDYRRFGFGMIGGPDKKVAAKDVIEVIESLAAELEITEAVAAQARGLECERDLLAAELEQVKQERDGLSIMLTAAQSASETYKRERDAAVEDLRGACAFCAHVRDCLVTGCSEDMGEACKQCPCETCIHDSNWQWRGAKEG